MVVFISLLFNSFIIPLAREGMKTDGKGMFKDGVPVDSVPANRHAATLANASKDILTSMQSNSRFSEDSWFVKVCSYLRVPHVLS